MENSIVITVCPNFGFGDNSISGVKIFVQKSQNFAPTSGNNISGMFWYLLHRLDPNKTGILP